MPQRQSQIRFELLGGFRLILPGQEPQELPPVQKNLLLAYLATFSQKRHLREELCTLFWEDSESARHSLRQALYTLRRQLADSDSAQEEESILVTTANTVSLLTEGVETDLALFEECCIKGMQEEGIQSAIELLESAYQLYKGSFLEGFSAEWIDVERNRVEALFEKLCWSLMERLEQSGEQKEAIEIANRLLQVNPLHEATYLSLIRLHALQGETPALLLQYDKLKRMLKAEYDTQPSGEIEAFVAKWREYSRSEVEKEAFHWKEAESKPVTVSPTPIKQIEQRETTEPFPKPTSFLPMLKALLGILGLFLAVLVRIGSFHQPKREAVSTSIAQATPTSSEPSSKPLSEPLHTINLKQTPCTTEDNTPCQQLEFDTDRKSTGYSVLKDSKDNLYLVGTMEYPGRERDVLITKLSPNLKKEWEEPFDGGMGDNDIPRAATLDREGNVIVTGTSYKHGGKGFGFVLKASPTGKILQSFFGDSDTGVSYGQCVACDSHNNLYIGGAFADFDGRRKPCLFKYSADFTKKRISLAESITFQEGDLLSIVIDERDFVYVAGECLEPKTAFIDCYTPEGERGWQAPRIYQKARGNTLALDHRGGLYVGLGEQWTLLKLSTSQGTEVDNYAPAGYPSYQFGIEKIALTPNGEVIITGEITQPGAVNPHIVLMKYSPTQKKHLWVQHLHQRDDSRDLVKTLDLSANGSIILAGSLHRKHQEQDSIVMVTDANGKLLHTWEPYKSEKHPSNGHWGVALHPTLGIVATGAVYTGDDNPRMLTMLYSFP